MEKWRGKREERLFAVSLTVTGRGLVKETSVGFRR